MPRPNRTETRFRFMTELLRLAWMTVLGAVATILTLGLAGIWGFVFNGALIAGLMMLLVAAWLAWAAWLIARDLPDD
jgi:hypothetical protein